MRQPIGEILNQRGVQASLADDDLVTDVVVVMKVVGGDGRPRVSLAWSEGNDWILRRGMLEVARDSEVLTNEDGETDD